ncbi:MAG: hypothetical protein BGO70_12420 [Bacteroidetes bacterium 43-93]|nr:hypothetical protein [Bacteroidota bacterium]OJW98259.1 MAG: hypothetical protein BGO70_12420 [Bacteroidetes bacterium 43-93]
MISIFKSETIPNNARGFYVAIDAIEKSEEVDIWYRFDGVEKGWAENRLSDDTIMTQFYDEISPFIFDFYDKKGIMIKNPGLGTVDEAEGKWFLIYISEEKNQHQLFQYVYDSPANEETKQYLYSIDVLTSEDEILDNLTSKFCLDEIKEADKDQLIQLFDNTFPCNGCYVGQYSVGQGNLSAICDPGGVPLTYFDVGGGCYRNYKTYKTPLRLCFSKQPLIIISHWDMDHIETARRDIVLNGKMSKFLSVNWIAPNQKISPSYTKLAHTISAVGKLFKWPSSITQLSFPFGQIIKCTGPGKNHSGLALNISLEGTHKFLKVLLPADAAYVYIPNIGKNKFDAIVATHHGAEFDSNNSPVCIPSINNAICYSYGKGNCYKHPKTNAINAHKNAGWLDNKETINGSVAINNLMSITHQPCNCKYCDLRFIQQFT